jgi:magnesium chelatase family protein
LDEVSKQLLKTAMERLNLSARAYDPDFESSLHCRPDAAPKVISSHIAEAIQYRSLDRDGWLG